MATSKMTEELLVKNLEAKDAWVARAMEVLFERQTALEQATSTTHLLNGRGFSAFDARAGSKLARIVMKGRREGRAYSSILWGQSLTRARKLAVKYRKQLLDAMTK